MPNELNPYADLMEQEAAGSDAQFKASAALAVTSNPDKIAQQRRVAGYLGMPLAAVEALPEQSEQDAKVKQIEAHTAQAPTLRAKYTDQDFAKLAHDDSGVLSGIEGVLRNLGSAAVDVGKYAVSAPGALDGGILSDVARAARAVASGAPKAGAGLYGAAAAPFELLGLSTFGGFLRDQQKSADAEAGRWSPVDQNAGIVERGVMSGLQSAGQNLITLPLGFAAKGQQMMLGTMGVITAGQSYGKGRDAGLSPARAIPYAVQDATAEVITERYLGAAGFLQQIKAGASAGKLFMYELAKEVPGEMAATLWQNFNEWTNVNPDKSVADFIKEQPAALAETAIATLVGGTTQIGAVKAVERAMGRATGEQQQAKRAEQYAADVQQFTDLLAVAKLRERAPDSFNDFIAKVAESGETPTELYIDAEQLTNTLNQSAITIEQLRAFAPSVAAQLESFVPGADVRVPVAEFAAAGPELVTPLLEHLRESPDAMSRAEAQEYVKAEGEKIRADVEKQLAQHADASEFQAQIKEATAQFQQQLDGAGKFHPKVNEAYASLLGNFYAVQALRANKTLQQFMQDYRLGVTSKDAKGAQQLNQGGALSDVAAQWDAAGISHTLSEKDGVITVSKIVVPQDERGAGKGTAAMRALLDYADATGQHIALSPSGDFGGNKARLVKFYKRFGFVENKGKNRAFSTSESMYRQADGKTLYQGSAPAIPPSSLTADASGMPVIRSAEIEISFGVPTDRMEFIPTDESQQMLNMAILSPAGDYLGAIDLLFMDGKPVALYDIEVNERKQGAGVKAIEAILGLSPDAKLHISNIVPSAQGFWEKLGIGVQNVEEGAAYDGEITQESYAASPASKKRAAAQGLGRGDAQAGGAGQNQLEQGNRGALHFGADITASPSVIALLEGADLSTFIHESGHFFLEVQADLAGRIQGAINAGEAVSESERAIVVDMEKILDWFGVKGNAQQSALTEWQTMTLEQKREHHEQWARGFEKYTMEGQAPSQELQALFARFRAWLVSVYKTLKGLNVTLTDDVRGVMDRMLASDEAISQAQDARNMGPLFQSPEQAGMTPEEYADYQAVAERATAQASAELDARLMKDMKWLSRARDKALKARQAEVDELRKEIEREVRAEVMSQPVYQAWQFLTGKSLRVEPGIQAPETIDPTRQSGKLRTSYLKETHPEEWKTLSERRMTSDTNGMDPDIVAEVIDGFSSGDELVKALAAAPSPQTVIEELTDRQMLERYGDIASQEALDRAADEAVHNELRARVIASELKALQKANTVPEKQGRSTVDAMARAAKDYAQQIIARQRVRDLRPSQYTAAEARSAKLAQQALGKSTEEAALHKRNQLVNNYAAKAAYDAQAEVKAARDYFKKFDKRSKGIDPGYQDQIEQLLESVELRQISLKEVDKRKSFAQWYAEQEEAGNAPNVPAELLANSAKRSYKDMTVEELRGLRDAVKQIEHQGRLKNRLLLARDKREFDAIAAEMADSIVEHGGKARPVELEGPNPVTDWFAGVAASHRKLASLFRQMDGNNDAGPMYEHIGRAMNERGTMEDLMVEQATLALRELYAPLLQLRGGITGYRSKVFIPEINASLTRGGRLAVALNWGNEANRQRIMDGDQWSDGQVRAILKTLSPAELEFVNKTWAYIDSYWDEIAAKEKRLTGVEPEKVEALPFTAIASDGSAVQMRGGYFPLKYDTDRSDRADTHEAAQAAKEMMQGVFTKATTRRGHTKERLKEVKRAVRKDLNVITQHVTQVVHDLAWHEWLIDTNKILSDEAIVQAIRAHYGPKVLKTMRDDVLGIATADVKPQTDIDAALLLLRSNVTRATMGASLTTAFLQPFGLTQSIVRIGGKHVLRGMTRWGGDAARMENTVGWIRGKSEFMRLRAKTFNRELREIRGAVAGQSQAMRVVDAGLFVMMQKMQLVADVPTWAGQYEKSLSEGLDEDAAIAMADRAVLESQGGGAIKDLAEVQRKHPMLTQFYSYFSVTLNLAAEQTAATNFKNPAAVAGWLGDMALLMVIPAILPSLIMFALKGGDGDDEKGWAKRIAEWQLGYLMGTVVGLRELSGAVSGFDYAGPPVGRLISDIGKAGKQTVQGEIDEPAVMAYINLMGSAFGIPTVQALRSYKGWKAWDEGKEGAGPQSVLFGPPPKH
jgi:GNAT superfamily N-acetyltransferase